MEVEKLSGIVAGPQKDEAVALPSTQVLIHKPF
jgi:hypothetical protein